MSGSAKRKAVLLCEATFFRSRPPYNRSVDPCERTWQETWRGEAAASYPLMESRVGHALVSIRAICSRLCGAASDRRGTRKRWRFPTGARRFKVSGRFRERDATSGLGRSPALMRFNRAAAAQRRAVIEGSRAAADRSAVVQRRCVVDSDRPVAGIWPNRKQPLEPMDADIQFAATARGKPLRDDDTQNSTSVVPASPMQSNPCAIKPERGQGQPRSFGRRSTFAASRG